MANQGVKYIYVLGDGDKIRERVEFLLLNGDIEKLASLSQSLVDAINKMKSLAISLMDADVIIAGGDDIFFRVNDLHYRRVYLEQLANSFQITTGSTFSFGVGTNVESAYLNLRRAKAFGYGQIVEEIAME